MDASMYIFSVNYAISVNRANHERVKEVYIFFFTLFKFGLQI